MAQQRTVDRQTTPAETISVYFRRVLHENPKLLEGRSNDELLRRWLADHPGEKEVPKSVKNGLQNIKSILRSKGRKKAAKPAEAAVPGVPSRPAAGKGRLEQLEERIDAVLTFARAVDPEGLESVISHVRRARNEVVWKLGE